MANLKRIELSDEVMLSFLKHINIPVDSVITWIGKSKQGIEIYINSKEFEETKELCTPDLFVIKYGKSQEQYNPLKASIYDDMDKLRALPSRLAIEARKRKKLIMKEYIKKNKKKIALIAVVLFPLSLPLLILFGFGFIISTVFTGLNEVYTDIIDRL